MALISKSNNIFIAGHRGMVGSAIRRNLLCSGYKNIITAKRNELDLTDTYKVNYWFKRNKPDVVIIAAAKVGGILANSRYPSEFLLEISKFKLI